MHVVSLCLVQCMYETKEQKNVTVKRHAHF
jgi:hypothetical protein